MIEIPSAIPLILKAEKRRHGHTHDTKHWHSNKFYKRTHKKHQQHRNNCRVRVQAWLPDRSVSISYSQSNSG